MTPDWSEARCAGYSYRPAVNADLFFPDNANHLGKRAREMCQACPIISDCLEWALQHERHGYWAGTHPEQRDDIRRRRNITLTPIATPNQCGTVKGYEQHRRNNEQACRSCIDAENRRNWERRRSAYAAKPKKFPPECGTTDGAHWHQTLNEPVCPMCERAVRNAQQSKRKRENAS